MYDPGLFSRPSPHLGEPYVPDNPRDYKETYTLTSFRPRTESFGRTGNPNYSVALVLVLGICGVTVFGLCAPFAWWLGTNAVNDMDGSEGSEYTLAQVGRYLGIIGTLILLFRGLVILFAVGGK